MPVISYYRKLGNICLAKKKTPVLIISQFPVIPSIISCCDHFCVSNIPFDVVLYIDDDALITDRKKEVIDNLGVKNESIMIIKDEKDLEYLYPSMRQDQIFVCDKSFSFKLEAMDLTEKKENIFIVVTPPRKPTKYDGRRITDRAKKKLAELGRPERNTMAYKNWRAAVFMRDKYTCALTGQKGGKLEAHHIKRWADHPELRYSIANGITLSQEAHKIIHGKEKDYESVFLSIAQENAKKNKVIKKRKYKRGRKGNPRAII